MFTGNVLAIRTVSSVESESTSTTVLPGIAFSALKRDCRQPPICRSSLRAMTTAATNGWSRFTKGLRLRHGATAQEPELFKGQRSGDKQQDHVQQARGGDQQQHLIASPHPDE